MIRACSVALVAVLWNCVWEHDGAFGGEPSAPPASTRTSPNRSPNGSAADSKDTRTPSRHYPSLDPESLASLLRPRLPQGWTVRATADGASIERGTPVEVYNGLGLPGQPSEPAGRRYIRKIMQTEKLVISLRLARRVTRREYERAVQQDIAAIKAAYKDNSKVFKFIPDDLFWRQHPEYGFQEVPSFDTGSQSIYVNFEPHGAVYFGREDHGGHLCQFWDKRVEKECQAVVDDLPNLFQTYATAGRTP